MLKKRVDVMSTVVETSRLPLLEFPRRFVLSDVLLRGCPKNDIAGSTSILLLYLFNYFSRCASSDVQLKICPTNDINFDH